MRDEGHEFESLELELAVVADLANVTRENKLNVMGIFQQVEARELPTYLPQVYLVGLWRTPLSRLREQFPTRVDWVEPNGEVTPVGQHQSQPTEVRYPKFPGRLMMIVPLSGVPFTQYGRHEFRMYVGEQAPAIVPIHVVNPEEE